MLEFIRATALPTFVIACLTTFILTPMLKKLALKLKICDEPCQRKIHQKLMPLLGGIALYFGIISTSLAHLPYNETLKIIISCASLITLLGIIDDIWNIGPYFKLAGQATIAFYTTKLGIIIPFISNPLGEGILSLGNWSILITIGWILLCINMINLIDGLDGLAAGIAAISAFFLAIIAFSQGQIFACLLSVGLMGACAGFLRYNFPPAQIFMGDSGSMLIGYLFAIISIIGVTKSSLALSFIAPILIFGVPISDTLYAIVRRLAKKTLPFKADKSHLHHLLLREGFTPKQVALMLYAATGILGIFALLLIL